jgi:hypothetical protein
MGKREENLKQFNASREDLLYDLEKLQSCIDAIRAKDPRLEKNLFLVILENLIVQSRSLMKRVDDNAYDLPRDQLIRYYAEMRGLIARFDDIIRINDSDVGEG